MQPIKMLAKKTTPTRPGNLCLGWIISVLLFASLIGSAQQIPTLGDTRTHDPSTMIKDGDRYYIFRTGHGLPVKSSLDKLTWKNCGRVFPGNIPAWTTNVNPAFDGQFWAPDLIRLNGMFYLYYSVSGFGTQVSSIGLATCTNLAENKWTDCGEVIHSTNGGDFNCIDPCILSDTNGTLWLGLGSYWKGIYLMQLDPKTGRRIAPNSELTRLASNSSIEASYLYQHGGYYYLFVNFGSCCSGIHSTYNIRIGRSRELKGPYVDRDGVKMLDGGGSLFLGAEGRFIGPGHAGILSENGTNWFTFHYYDGQNGGIPALGLAKLKWTADGWPELIKDSR